MGFQSPNKLFLIYANKCLEWDKKIHFSHSGVYKIPLLGEKVEENQKLFLQIKFSVYKEYIHKYRLFNQIFLGEPK